MDNTQHTYFAELKLALQKAGYTVQPVESSLLPIQWHGQPLCRVTESGGIQYRQKESADSDAKQGPQQGHRNCRCGQGLHDSH